MQGTLVQSLVKEIRSHMLCMTTKPSRSGAGTPQPEKPTRPDRRSARGPTVEAHAPRQEKRTHPDRRSPRARTGEAHVARQEKPRRPNRRSPRAQRRREVPPRVPHAATKTQHRLMREFQKDKHIKMNQTGVT